jgi:hypothetical protein
MDPDAAKPDPGLEQFRPYFDFLVRHRLDDRLKGKRDASGVVQQTLWEAHQGWKDFRGRSEAAAATQNRATEQER